MSLPISLPLKELVANAEDWSAEMLKEAIEELEYQSKLMNDKQLAVKLVLNSIYGCLGAKFFAFFDKDIAETITLQGQHLIKYMEEKINTYMMERWHLDTELHAHLGISDRNISKIKSACGIYMDTDSLYLNFGKLIDSVEDFSELNVDERDFILGIYNFRLLSIIEDALEAYAKSFNTENVQDFEMETISDTAVFLGKKKYFQLLSWKDKVKLVRGSKISIKGFETAKSDTPSFCRKKLKEIVEFILKSDKLDLKAIAQRAKSVKEEFKVADIEQISENKKISSYDGVLCDTTKLEFTKGLSYHIKAAGYYNYLLNRASPEIRAKYPFILEGDKMKLYRVAPEVANRIGIDYFAYKAGHYPYELAPPIDYDGQYQKYFLDIINRVVEATGNPAITPNFIIKRRF